MGWKHWLICCTLIERSNMKTRWVLISIPLLFFAAVLAATIGSAHIAVGEAFQSLAGKLVGAEEILPKTQAMILYGIRWPRVLLSLIAGAALATAGLALQGLFRNPLADPYIIGISSGSAFGAAVAIATGIGSSLLGNFTVTASAFLGALGALAFVYQLGREGKVLRQSRVLLAGISVGQLFAAGLSLMMVFYAKQMDKIVYWTMGSVAGNSMEVVLFCLGIVGLGYAIFHHYRMEMNLLLLGEDTAKSMGVNTESVKRILLLTASLVTASVVSFTGIIGFVGLIIPHIIRLLTGPDHRTLLPLTAIWGAIFLCFCDTLARTLASPLEIPIGIVTAIIGAPFFLWLLSRREGGEVV